MWVNAVYLDSISAGKRLGSRKYSDFSTVQFFNTFISSPIVETSPDSSMITVSGNFRNTSLPGTYYPKMVKPGASPHGVVLSIQLQSIFGIIDSVAKISLGMDTLWWSKSFGIIKSKANDGELSLVGVKDLAFGIQDKTFRLKPLQVGDVIHYWRYAYGTITCNLPNNPPSSVSQNEKKQIRIMAISPNISGDNLEIIESDSGASTGIMYSTSQHLFGSNMAMGDSVLPLGKMMRNNPYNGKIQGIIGPDGNFLKIVETIIIDQPSYFTILPCTFLGDEFGLNPFFYASNPIWCNGGIDRFQYPQYINIQGGCTFGQPYPSVTITQTKADITAGKIKALPNPARETIYFEGISEAKIEIMDAFGKKLLVEKLDNQPLKIHQLSPGMYFYSLHPSNQKPVKGRFIKE